MRVLFGQDAMAVRVVEVEGLVSAVKALKLEELAAWQRRAFGNRLAGPGAAVDIRPVGGGGGGGGGALAAELRAAAAAAAGGGAAAELEQGKLAPEGLSRPAGPSGGSGSPWRLFGRPSRAEEDRERGGGQLGGGEELNAREASMDGAAPPDLSFLLYPDADSVPLALVPAFAAEYVRLCNR